MKYHQGLVQFTMEVIIMLQEPTSEPESARPRGSETILFADDEPGILRMSREILTKYGFTVLTASDGVEALEVFESHRDAIQVVVTDLTMPRMNGREAATEMRRYKPDLPVILVSGRRFEIVDLKEIHAHNFIFLQKPVNYMLLAKTIRARLA
jgi:CheY-like chemotaxis protein